MPDSKKLIIFDLDQTILDILPIHDKALEKAFKDVFGMKARFEEVDFAGKTVDKTLSELAKKKGVKNITNKSINLVIKKYKSNFSKIIPNDISRYILPGIKDLLKALKGKHILAVMTGSAHGVPELILKKAKLADYFDAIVCGTEAKSKEEMIKIIIRRLNYKANKMIVIGDSTRDIAAGKFYGATTIAVNTGPHTRRQLREAKPNFIFDNLQNYKKAISILEKIR